ncbi:MAG: hypothetical protein ACJ798_11695 [Phenylobacterium sp.]
MAQDHEPAAKGFRIEGLGIWLMGAYWLAMLGIVAAGAALSGG